MKGLQLALCAGFKKPDFRKRKERNDLNPSQGTLWPTWRQNTMKPLCMPALELWELIADRA